MKHYISGLLILAAVICIGDTAASIIIASALVCASAALEAKA